MEFQDKSLRCVDCGDGFLSIAPDHRIAGPGRRAWPLFLCALIRGLMEIAERTAGDVTILDVTGKMTLGEGDEILKDKVHSLSLQGRKKIVLNLAGVPYIDS